MLLISLTCYCIYIRASNYTFIRTRRYFTILLRKIRRREHSYSILRRATKALVVMNILCRACEVCGKLGWGARTGTSMKPRRASRRFQVTAHPYIRLNYLVSVQSARRYSSVCARRMLIEARDSLARAIRSCGSCAREGATRKATILN